MGGGVDNSLLQELISADPLYAAQVSYDDDRTTVLGTIDVLEAHAANNQINISMSGMELNLSYTVKNNNSVTGKLMFIEEGEDPEVVFPSEDCPEDECIIEKCKGNPIDTKASHDSANCIVLKTPVFNLGDKGVLEYHTKLLEMEKNYD